MRSIAMPIDCIALKKPQADKYSRNVPHRPIPNITHIGNTRMNANAKMLTRTISAAIPPMNLMNLMIDQTINIKTPPIIVFIIEDVFIAI